jgi:hypothetical protein
MSTQLARDLARLQAGGFYLPSLAYGYLFARVGGVEYLILGSLSLIGAVLTHGLLNATIGPDGEALPISRATFVKLFQHAIYKEKEPSDYPGDLWDAGMLDHAIPRRRKGWIGLVAVTEGTVERGFRTANYAK